MSITRSPIAARWLLAATLAAAAGAASARNDKLMLPIQPALAHPGTRQMVANDVALRFGGAAAVAGGGAVVEAHAVADPFGAPNTNAGGSRTRRSDADTCLDAFRRALMDLQQRARVQGGTAVVGIVSNYNRQEMDSRDVFECRAGNTRAVVDLKGTVVRTPVAAVQAPQLPPPVMAPIAPVAPLPAVTHADPVQPPRIASGFAAIDDIDAIPYLSDRGRASYSEWLKYPTPRAFAISSTGFFFSTSGLTPRDSTLPTDPVERALVGCERNAKTSCRLYAVNGSVVWTREPR